MRNTQPKSMKVDLARIYAMVKQRAERDRESPWALSAQHARELAKQLLFSPTILLVKRFEKAEQVWLSSRARAIEPLAVRFSRAIESGNYYVYYRTVNTLNTGYDPTEGWIYLLTSSSRPDQVKIGSTTASPRARLVRFRRIQDSKAILHWARWVARPARLEALLHAKFKALRVAGNTIKESTEWFHIEAQEVEFAVLRMLKPGCEFWRDEIKYTYDPEGRSIRR